MGKWLRVGFASLLVCATTAVGISRADNVEGFAGVFGALIQQAQQAQAQRQNDLVSVQRLQIALRRLGFYHGKIDGHMGAGTSASVLEFYSQNNRTPPSQITTDTVVEIEDAASQASPSQSAQNSNSADHNGEGPSFSCDGNLSQTERTICNDENLSNLDQQMNGAYRQAIANHSSADQQNEIQNRARQFRQRRDACGTDSDCIQRSYERAVADIGADVASPTDTNHKLGEVKGFEPNLKLQNGRAWILVASRENLSDALTLSDNYADKFDSAIVMRSPKGPFAISIGWVPKDMGRDLLDNLKSNNLVPSDSFLSDGQDYSGPIFAKAKPNPNSRDLLVLLTMLRPSAQELAHMQDNGSSIKLLIDYPLRVGGLSPSDDYIGMRNQPDASKKPQYLLPHGTMLQKISENSDWIKAQAVSGISGWFQKSYLKPLNYSDSHDVTATQEASTSQDQSTSKISATSFDQTQKDDIRKHSTLLLSDIDAYLKTDPKIDDLSSLAELVGQLKKYQTTEDYVSLQGSIQKLEEKAAPLSGYKDFISKRDQARQEADARSLEGQVADAKGYVFFMQFYIKNNVTADAAPQMATLLNRYEEGLKSPSLVELTSLNSDSKALISKSGLDSQYKNKMTSFAPSDDAANARTLAEVPLQFASGPAKPLLMGDGTDFVMVYNDTSLAPNIVKNLKGDFEFIGGNARVCSFYALSDADVKRGLLAYLTSKGAPNIDLDTNACNEAEFLKYDLLVGQRKQVLGLTQHYMMPVLKLMEEGKLKLFAVAGQSDISGAAPFTKDTLVTLESDILAGAKTGFGLVRVENASSTICAIIDGEVEPHLLALKDQSRAVAETVGDKFNWKVSDADHVFLSAKKGECGAAYGDAKSLAVLMQALKRDGIAYHLAPLWIDNATILKLQGVVESERQDKIKQQAEKQQNVQDETKLAAARAVDEAAQKVTIEKKLRDENGPRARTKSDAIRDSLKDLADGKQTWTANVFPEYSTWYASQLQDHWELVSIDASVHDFGNAKWKDRTLEAAFADTHVTMKNRILGETKDFCWVLGGIDDAEYQVERVPVAVRCEQADDILSRWFVGNGFVSQWVTSAGASK